MSATMTLIGLYNFDESLFDEMTVPDGLDRDTLIQTICLNSADFEVQYPDPEFSKRLIGQISRKWGRTFVKWKKALDLEYDPIYNYDRHEEWADEGTDTGTVKNDESATSSEKSSGNGDTETSVTTYDSGKYKPDGKSASKQSAESSGTDKSNRTETRDLRNGAKHTGHLYGNIGVTTSQQMLEAELEISYWNLYEHMADVFVRELCIAVY